MTPRERVYAAACAVETCTDGEAVTVGAFVRCLVDNGHVNVRTARMEAVGWAASMETTQFTLHPLPSYEETVALLAAFDDALSTTDT